MESAQKIAVIVGASAGIGWELAKRYHHEGYRVALLARRLDRLDQLASEMNASRATSAIAVRADVTDRASLDSACAEILKKLGRIDTVVANAGFGVSGRVDQLTTADYRRQFDTNVFGVLDCFYAFDSALRERGGRFGIVGSVNSYVALPSASAYCMSKFSVRALAESLHWEMKSKNVSVTLICPGFVRSEIRMVDNQGSFKSTAKESVPDWLMMEADVAARKTFRAIEAGRRELVFTGHGKIAVWIERHCPWVFAPVLKKLGVSSRSKTRSWNATDGSARN